MSDDVVSDINFIVMRMLAEREQEVVASMRAMMLQERDYYEGRIKQLERERETLVRVAVVILEMFVESDIDD